ncbi:hypothetical protein H0H92_008120 [Tricholoma furcatifolium]|nr:hypothetical protein H0H92_008120 [Tricholoma furcatifolium]
MAAVASNPHSYHVPGPSRLGPLPALNQAFRPPGYDLPAYPRKEPLPALNPASQHHNRPGYPRKEPIPALNPAIRQHNPPGYPRNEPLPALNPAVQRHDRSGHPRTEPFPALQPAFRRHDLPNLDREERQRRQRRAQVEAANANRLPDPAPLQPKKAAKCHPSRDTGKGLHNPVGTEPPTSAPDVTEPNIPVPQAEDEHRQEVFHLLSPYVPQGRWQSVVRRFVDRIPDRQLPEVMEGLNRSQPFSAEQIELLEHCFPEVPEEIEPFERALDAPLGSEESEAGYETFWRMLEILMNRLKSPFCPPAPPPTPDVSPSGTPGGSKNPLGRTMWSRLAQRVRRAFRPKQGKDDESDDAASSVMSSLEPAEPMGDDADEFTAPIVELRLSRLARHVIEDFACTRCGTAIRAVS